MKIAIQGLGEVPSALLFVLEREKPEACHIICSDYQLKYVAKHAGYDKSNERVLEEAAERLGVDVIFHLCDVFDPSAVGEELGKILEKVDSEKDELIVNYTGGSAVVKLLLGAVGVLLSTVMKAKVIYAIKYPHGMEISRDHTEVLKGLFKRLGFKV
jgi:homoserine dehydrogenase